ncbi:Abi-domain-containing protein [Neocallimastix californiae]|jgi:membrane protease YdiL (CAAX protease family)|uniref:Abi-domain-containing protein n=1 Tax=Neocallimastix californiae TaxID=1754190 RepID=A0A1Y2F8A1_9FUNG|nr:Abi-domain-containing protein [Neocallimastix californiae]|eukprot:ORY80121.1 Abi-domain-containing protein [Neocallimastix californiae]
MTNFIDTGNNEIEVNVTSNPDNERAIEKQSNIVIDIPKENEEKRPSKDKKEREHVNFFKQFLLPRVYITALISAVVIISFSIIYSIILNKVLTDVNNSNEEKLNETYEKYPVIAYVCICIIAPIFEELIFRGLIFGLIKKFSVVLAYIVSSFLFAFAHFEFEFSTLISEIYYFPFYFITGVIFAYTYNYDGYLLASILSHILNNTAKYI